MTADEYIQAAPTFVLYDSLTKTRSVLEQYQNVLVYVSGGADSDDMVDVVEHLKTERILFHVAVGHGNRQGFAEPWSAQLCKNPESGSI